MDELLKRLNRYTRQCLSERTDPDFADAVEEVKNMLMAFGANAHRYASIVLELKDCRNELCQKCGEYKTAHLGSCDGCRWKDGG